MDVLIESYGWCVPLWTAAGLTIASLLYLVSNPVFIVKTYMRWAVTSSGMKIKRVKVGNLFISYGEKGTSSKQQSSILLLHGLSADKFMWAPLVRRLPSDLHVIALDLPGHGDSDEPDKNADLSLESLVQHVHKFVEAVGLDSQPFHVVGLSLGGALAGLYSAWFPQHVERVTLICPAMRTPEICEVFQRMKEVLDKGTVEDLRSICPLIPDSPGKMLELFHLAQYNTSTVKFIPRMILVGAVEMRRPRNNYYFKLFRALTDEKNYDLLERNLHKITMPSQVIWGEHDKIIHVSGVDVLKSKLPDCRSVEIISRCGHAMNLDRPGCKTKHILNFRNC